MAQKAYYREGQYYIDKTVPSVPVLYRCTTAGDNASSVWAKISGGGSGSGFPFRGLYVSASTYNTFDIVQMGPGTSAGMYMSLIDGNTNSPDSGIGWTQFTSFATWL